MITSGGTEDGGLAFKTTVQAERFYDLLMRHWNDINRTFRSGEVYMPVLGEDDAGETHGNDWAVGFLRGTQMRHDVWDPIIQDDDRGGVFVPLMSRPTSSRASASLICARLNTSATPGTSANCGTPSRPPR